MNTSPIRVAVLAVTLGCTAAGLAGCDELQDSAGPSTAASQTAPPSGTSPIDGRPIIHLTEADLAAGTYAASVRQALVGADLSAAPTTPDAPNGDLLAKDVFAAQASRGVAVPSAHVVLTEGSGHHAYTLTIRRVAGGSTIPGPGADSETYIVLDPEVFHPADETLGRTTVREIPATALSTGQSAKVEMTATSSTVNGNEVSFVVVEAVPVIDAAAASLMEAPCDTDWEAVRCGGKGPVVEGPSRPGASLVRTYLGVERLRLNQNFDTGLTINEKQEVEFVAGAGDSYTSTSQIPREATRHFDAAFWTVGAGSPTTGTTTAQALFQANDGFGNVARKVWFYPRDVNYKDVDYNFANQYFVDCEYVYNPYGQYCANSTATMSSFPAMFLTSSDARAVMHEDDWDLHTFSTRDGDWSGSVGTYNFATETSSQVTTWLDGNNHDLKSSDRAFTSSGLRKINLSTVGRIGSGTREVSVGGLVWRFRYGTLTIPNWS